MAKSRVAPNSPCGRQLLQAYTPEDFAETSESSMWRPSTLSTVRKCPLLVHSEQNRARENPILHGSDQEVPCGLSFEGILSGIYFVRCQQSVHTWPWGSSSSQRPSPSFPNATCVYVTWCYRLLFPSLTATLYNHATGNWQTHEIYFNTTDKLECMGNLTSSNLICSEKGCD